MGATEHPLKFEVNGSGTPAGHFSLPAGVGVDAQGMIYEADFGTNVVNIFDSAGNFVTRISDSHLSFPVAVAVDAAGDVFVANSSNDVVEYSPSSFPVTSATTYSFDSVLDSGGSRAVAIDDATGDVYVDDSTKIVIYNSSGTSIATIGAGLLDSSAGVAVDDSTGDVYASDEGANRVWIFNSAGVPTGSISGSNTPTGSFTGNALGGVAVDQSDGDVYVTDAHQEAVDEFDSTGAYVTSITGTPAFSLSTFSGVAVDDSGTASVGSVYVDDTLGAELFAFGPAVTTPDVTTGAATNLEPTSATVSGTVNPDGVEVTSCKFDYGTSSTYGQSAPCAEVVGVGSTAVTVDADLTGLTPDTTYHYRLEAGNAQGTGFGPDQTFISPSAPIIDDEFSSDVGPTGATINAQIDPAGSDTTYHFEWGTDTSYGNTTPATDVGSARSDQAVDAQLTGVQPGVTYHYRVVAVNQFGQTEGPDATFRYYNPGSGLPDGRAYELVSPADTDGKAVDVPGTPGVSPNSGMFSSADGSQVTFDVPLGALPNTGAGSGTVQSYVASRGTDGWTSLAISPSTTASTTFAAGNSAANLADISPDFSRWYFNTTAGLDPNDQNNTDPALANGYDVYASGPGQGWTWISHGDTLPDTNPADASYAGSSADGSRVFFTTARQLLPAAPSGVQEIYESSGGALQLVSLLPDGSPAPAPFGATVGSGAGAGVGTVASAITSDGSLVVFEAGDPSAGLHTEVFVRDNGATVEASASQKTNGAGPGGSDASGPQDATFWGASSDGSKVVFTSSAELTNNATTGSADQGNDLYQYDVTSGTLTDLSVDTNSADATTGADVQGVVEVSDDGSHVYFVATGQLIPGQGTDGRPNLYLWNSGTLSYIATLSPADKFDWTNNADDSTARLSPDGLRLLFLSDASLTGYSNASHTEAYEYDSQANSLTCVSCAPSGAQAAGDADLGEVPFGDGLHIPRSVDNDGRTFFDSTDPLVPQATNGKDNVYEWEPATVGSCTQPGGCTYLISDGTGQEDSSFIDASSDGTDVFLTTTDSLVPQDQEAGVQKLYDARIGGGFPVAQPAPQCSGDSCQGTPSATPVSPAAASIAFAGPGNSTTRTIKTTQVTAQVRVTGKAVKGETLTLTVKTPAKGKITISGAKVKELTRSVARAGSYKLVVHLNAQELRTLKRELTAKQKALAKRTAKRKRPAAKAEVTAKVGVKVAYNPASGKPSTATVTADLEARA